MKAYEIGNFRTCLFGGFNRNDVIKYVELLAGQRNSYKERVSSMEDEIDELRLALEKAREEKIEAQEEALRTGKETYEKVMAITGDLMEEISRASEDISSMTENIIAQQEKIGGFAASMNQMLLDAKEKLASIENLAEGEGIFQGSQPCPDENGIGDLADTGAGSTGGTACSLENEENLKFSEPSCAGNDQAAESTAIRNEEPSPPTEDGKTPPEKEETCPEESVSSDGQLPSMAG